MAKPPILLTPNFLLPASPGASDYRCVVNAAGTQVVFERTVSKSSGGSGETQLYLHDLTEKRAKPFIQDSEIVVSTRPDWCWRTGDVAFNFSSDICVGIVDSSGGNFQSLGAQTARMNYPTWFPDGEKLAVENYATTNSGPDPVLYTPLPNTTTIHSSTGVVAHLDIEGLSFWGGMPSVNPVKPHLIAFAGQAVSGSGYNEDMNYIYVMDTAHGNDGGFGPIPLESGAPTSGTYNPSYQARAPWWSPCGEWVVFESNRPSQHNANGLYALYLYRHGGSEPARQITSTIYNCNHAKWFPNGFPGGPPGAYQLIVASSRSALTNPTEGPYGLSSLDLTPLGITF
jgi:Tol biopolymer transport system component